MTQALEDHRFPTRNIPRMMDETCCSKCGAGGNCHEVIWDPGLLTRKCRICGTATYLYVNRRARGLYGKEDIVLTDRPMGRPPLRMTPKICANCFEDYLGHKTRYCPKCQRGKGREARKKEPGVGTGEAINE